MGEREVAGLDEDAATHVESAEHLPSAASIRRSAVRPAASDVIRTRLHETGDGGRLGRYLILRLIGEGGVGMVFAAYDEDLDRKVAIKLLRTDRPGAGLDKHALLAEAKAMARLSHPNVVQIYDVGEVDDQVFVAMEMIQGVTLRDWLHQRTRTTGEVVRAFVEAGRGLQAVHHAGLVHRDFKPQNVLVSADGRVRVLDFGLAFLQRDAIARGEGPIEDANESVSSASSEALAGQMTGGTPAYMSPEQHLDAPLDARSDQFSFCVALYQAVYGERPFAGKAAREIAASVIAGEVRSPPADSRVPAWLRRVILRGLAREPAQRWPTMAALLDALQRDPWALRLRALAGVGLLLTLAAALAAVVHYRSLAAEQEAQVCAGGPARLADVWDPTLRAAVGRAFLATELAYAGDTWSKVQKRLDSFGEAWVTAHRTTCEDHRRGELSPALYDRATACLDGARRDLGALVHAFAAADAMAVEKAVKAVERLPNLERCADREALVAQVRPPDDATTATAVEELRDTIAATRAEVLLSRAQRCGELVPLVARARELSYRPVLAELLALQGDCAELTGEYGEAVTRLREATLTALAAGHEVAVFSALLKLAYITGDRHTRYAEAHVWLDLAEAVVERAGADDGLHARILIGRGALLLNEGKVDESLAATDQGLALLERRDGPPTTDVAAALNNRAAAYIRLGDRARVSTDFERSLAIYREILGPEHPLVATVLSNLGNVRALSGDVDGAEALQREALALKERLLGPEHPDIALLLNNLGGILEKRADYVAAQAAFERAVEIREKSLGADHPSTASALANLAELLNDRGRADEALPLLRRALAIRERAHEGDHPMLAGVLVRLARSELLLGHNQEARRHLERATAIFARTPASPEETSYAHFNLARAVWATSRTPRERARARATAEQALASANREALAKEVADLEAWLAATAPGASSNEVKRRAG